MVSAALPAGLRKTRAGLTLSCLGSATPSLVIAARTFGESLVALIEPPAGVCERVEAQSQEDQLECIPLPLHDVAAFPVADCLPGHAGHCGKLLLCELLRMAQGT